MKQYLAKRVMFAAFALLSVPASLLAQKETENRKEEKKEKKDVQQIIITRKGDKEEKTVIEIKGDKVTVNGKDVSKVDDITVNLNNLSELRALRLNGMADDHNFNFDFNTDANTNFYSDADNHISLFNEDANRAMLGVTTDEDDKGAKVTTVSKASAAEKAGLKVGDIITKIGDEEIEDADDVSKAVRKHKPGDKVTVTVLRSDKEQKITAELGKWKGIRINNLNATIAPSAPNAPDAPAPYRSFNRIDFNSGPKLGLSVQDTDEGNGVKVLDVAEESNAAKAGVKKGDIITRINDEEVSSTDEVKEAMREARTESSFKLQVLRDGKPQTIDVRIPRKLKTTNL